MVTKSHGYDVMSITSFKDLLPGRSSSLHRKRRHFNLWHRLIRPRRCRKTSASCPQVDPGAILDNSKIFTRPNKKTIWRFEDL